MKKLLVFGTILLLVCLLFSFASADTAIGDEESLVTLMNQHRESNADTVEFKATKDYYKELSANNFGLLRAIGLKCGLSRMSIRNIRYSDKSRTIQISGIEWVEPHAVECHSPAEVREAIFRFARDGITSFEIICDKDTARSITNNYLHSCMAQCGYEDYELSWLDGKPKTFYFDNPKAYSIPWYTVTTEDEYRTALEYMWQQNAESFYIVMTPDLYKTLKDDRLRMVENASQMDKYHVERDSSFMRYKYTYVSYSDEPRIVCQSEEEMKETIRLMGSSDISAFRLILPKDLYGKISAGQFSKLKTLVKEAGMSEYSLRYSEDGVLLFSDAVIESDAVMLNTVEDAIAYMESCAAEGRTEITLFCSKSLYTTLIGNIKAFALEEDLMAPIYDLISQAGLNSYSCAYSASSNIIQIRDITYYPGFRILNAVKAGDTSALTSREQETLEAAQEVSAACTADSPLETARNIHDWLCNKVVYTDDESTDEDDNAIGAILTGEANCDGYADAFYLIGSLSGLEVRCQHGDSYKTGFGAFLNKVTHMWNLLKIDGTWRLVDVTWDDREDYISYTWFNLGQDRASRMHIWNGNMTVPLLPETDLTTRPANEYLIHNMNEANDAIRDALANGYPVFELICAEDNISQANLENTLRGLISKSYRYSWNEHMLTMLVLIP